MLTAVAVGYYRFTDIIFEWHNALPNPEDIGPLKALLHTEALVHPDHPLRKPGIDGIELFLGTFPSGEARLLFSSAQIEYIRYWLHSMELTKEIIPIPGGDYLIQPSDMSTCAPDVYNNPTKLKKAIKEIDKRNKKVKGLSEPLLQARRINFERVRILFAEKKGVWLAIDFEDWEWDHTALLEFGYSRVRWDNGQEVADKGHWVVKENRKFTNSKFVAGNRDHYLYGQSEDVPLRALKARICEMIAQHRVQGAVFLVFHDPSQDIKCLRDTINAPIDGFSYLLPDTVPGEGVFIIDSAELFGALVGDTGTNKRSLEQVCRQLQIHAEYLHNAGNDAHVTMLAMKSMASGEPCDTQRERRWPGRSAHNAPKLLWQPWEVDEDYSDTEGLFPVPDYHMQPNGDDTIIDNLNVDDD